MNILDQTQEQRDEELSKLTGVSLTDIQGIEMCSPDTIRIYNGGTLPEDIVDLYRDFKYLDLVGYYKTLMMTSVKRRNRNLTELLRNSRDARCLDFGSGVGTHAIALMQNDNVVSLLDVEGPLLQFASDRIQYYNLDNQLENIYYHDDELPPNTFDIVICADVLEHVPRPINDLKRIYQCLKPGGLLHLEVSTMVKPMSGHFKASINEWNYYGPQFLGTWFTLLKPSIFRRK